MHSPRWYAVFGLSLLGLAACGRAVASVAVTVNGDEPKAISNQRSLQFLRDSVFHSYMDSLDLRIETLNRAARTVDSLARELRTFPKLKLHVNGHCFGPLYIPSQEVGSDSVKVTTPEVRIPEIEIPDLDINFNGDIFNGTVDGPELSFDGNLSITGLTTPSSYYYYDGNSRYYIRNVVPDVKAKRAPNSSSVWLLDSK